MITKKQAIQLLKKYHVEDKRIAHCKGVAEFAFTLAEKIHECHPELPVDPQKVKIAALLHDIGRGVPGDHELNSVNILIEENLPELASIVIHGSIYEIMLLRGVNDESLIPKTIENKIVAYADTRFRDQLVSMEERWAEIEERRKDESEKIKSLQMVKERFRGIEKELLMLLEI